MNATQLIAAFLWAAAYELPGRSVTYIDGNTVCAVKPGIARHKLMCVVQGSEVFEDWTDSWPEIPNLPSITEVQQEPHEELTCS